MDDTGPPDQEDATFKVVFRPSDPSGSVTEEFTCKQETRQQLAWDWIHKDRGAYSVRNHQDEDIVLMLCFADVLYIA